MALIIILIGTYIIYLINRKKFIGKTNTQKVAKLGVYALGMIIGMFIFFEILHIMKYHSFN